jgi:uncharacterized damage-inducible protein DinB
MLVRLFDHAHWANGVVLGSLQSAPDPPQRAIQLHVHILTTEQIYFERATGKDPFPQDFWPDLPLSDCSSLNDANHSNYQQLLSTTNSSRLQHKIRYRNSKGSYFETPLAEMLHHVTLHGEHHRGQLALLLREIGVEPAVTDLITFTRLRG